MAESKLHAGVARIDVTPPMGVEMCGYGPYEKRVCTDVLDPLCARGLWLQCGGEAVVIITADLCTVDASTRNEAAERISRRAGIPPENILIAASHTHSGPSTQLMIGWGERDPGYMRHLPMLFAEAALQARDAARPARLGCARKRVWNVGVNREQPEFGPLDTATQLLRVDREDGSTMAVVFNFGAHAVTRYPYTSRISADWPGLAAACLRHELGGPVALFLQGCCGNINGHNVIFHRTDPQTRQKTCDMQVGWTAQHFCDQVLPAVRAIKTEPAVRLKAIFRIIPLPCVQPDRNELQRAIDANVKVADSMSLAELRPLHERIESETKEEQAWRRARFDVDSSRHQLGILDDPPEAIEAPLQVLGIGDAAIVGWPGEVFVELGIEARQRSPRPMTFVASFSNGCVGYIPTEAAFESQGRPNQFGIYPCRMTPRIYGRLPFRSDVPRVLVEETIKTLAAL